MILLPMQIKNLSLLSLPVNLIKFHIFNQAFFSAHVLELSSQTQICEGVGTQLLDIDHKSSFRHCSDLLYLLPCDDDTVPQLQAKRCQHGLASSVVTVWKHGLRDGTGQRHRI